MRRWLLRILLTLAVLLILVIIGVQVVLKTNLPRNLVLSQVQKALQLRVDAASLSTGWAGDTVLHDVTLSLPLESQSFLTVKTLTVKHTSLPGIALTQGVKVKSLTFDRPELFVRQDAAGRWNVAEVIDLLARAGGRKQAADTPQPEKTDQVVLPEITLTDGIVNVIDRQGRTARVDPLNVSGKPQGPLVWHYDATAGDADRPALKLTGKLAPGGAWEHEVDLAVADLSPWLKPWLATPSSFNTVQHTRFTGNWRGRRRDDGAVTGLLTVTQFTSAPYAATGLLYADYNAGALTLRPDRLKLTGIAALDSDLLLKSGQIVFENQRLHTDRLTATVSGGDVQISAAYGLADQSADASVYWSALALPAGYVQSGSLNARVRRNFPDTLLVDTTVDTAGAGQGLAWQTKLQLKGSGQTLKAIDWELAAPTLRVTRDKQPFNLDGLALRARDDARELRLTDIAVPAGELAPGRPRGTLTGQAAYRWPTTAPSTQPATQPADPAAGRWWVYLAGADWRVFQKRDLTAGFYLDASGDLNAPGKQDWARVAELYASTNTGVRVSASGNVSYLAPGKPADVWVYAWYPPFEVDPLEAGETLRGGEFHSHLHLSGGAWPPSLDLNGALEGSDLVIGPRKVGDLSMQLAGRADALSTGGWTARVRTEHLKLLEGSWNIAANYTSPTGASNLQLDLEDLPLQKLDDLLPSPPKLTGNLNGSWHVRLPSPTVDALDVDGDWHVKNFSAAKGRFAADTVDGKLFARRGQLAAREVIAHRNDGGEIRARLAFGLRTPTQMQVGLRAAAWPVTFPNGSALLYAQSKQPIDLDLKKLAATGPFELDVYPIVDKVDLGVVRTEGALAGRLVSVTVNPSDVLGGSLAGTARYDLDDLLRTRANLTFKNVSAQRLTPLVPAMKEATGAVDVALAISPPTEPRPLGPLQIDLAVTAAPTFQYRTIPVQLLNLRAFYDGDGGTDQRFVIDEGTKPDDPSQVDHRSRLVAAGGQTLIFARATRHPLVPTTQVARAKALGEDILDWSYNVQLQADDLDLNALVHAASPKAGDHTGRLGARVSLVGDPRAPRQSFGEGELRLSKTDLAGNSVISALYAAMSVKIGNKAPDGRGRLTFRLEDDRLNITHFYFFNRGVEARGTGSISHVWSGPDATADAFVVGSARPLKDLKLPFAADVDKVLAVIQRDVTTVRVTGPLGDPKIKPAGFGDIGQALRAIILSDVRGETRDSAAP